MTHRQCKLESNQLLTVTMLLTLFIRTLLYHCTLGNNRGMPRVTYARPGRSTSPSMVYQNRGGRGWMRKGARISRLLSLGSQQGQAERSLATTAKVRLWRLLGKGFLV